MNTASEGPPRPTGSRCRQHVLPAVVCLALAIVHTWPLATAPGTLSRNDNGDTQLNEWILAWVPHQLARDPAHLFDANIFYPARDTLAFSEPLIVPALMGAPLQWVGGSPVFVYNVVLIAGFALTAFAGYALMYAWTRGRAAGLLTGSLFAFNTHTLTRLAHIQGIHAYGLPLALLSIDRVITEARMRDALWLAVWMAVMAYTSGYLIVFGSVMIAVALIARIGEWRHRTRLVLSRVAVATAAAVIVVLPLYLPYQRVAREQGLVRSLENVAGYTATLKGYAASAGRMHFTLWSHRLFENPVDAFVGCAGVILSLGPSTPVYGALYQVFPPVRGLRAAARFGNLFLLAIAVLAGWGLHALRPRARSRTATALAVAVVAAANIEALRAPFEYRRFHGIPRIYSLLADVAGPVVLVEVPFYPVRAAFENAEYVLASTAHWRPLMNGYSGFTPASYRTFADTFWYFPEERAIQAMQQAGVTHVMLHPVRFGRDAERVVATVERRSEFERVAMGPIAHGNIRLYRLRPKDLAIPPGVR
ncbi:MAG: hypothetical protein LC753_19630 [Acidobacteria bacterium]|nr:hypothetical protein [Acidobacteriota bacterium]